jgi:hypothetical protein
VLVIHFASAFQKPHKLHLFNYSDVTQESIVITLLFGLIMYVMYYALLLR